MLYDCCKNSELAALHSLLTGTPTLEIAFAAKDDVESSLVSIIFVFGRIALKLCVER